MMIELNWKLFVLSQAVINSILPGGMESDIFMPVFLYHPEMAQAIKLTLSVRKDTLIRHI